MSLKVSGYGVSGRVSGWAQRRLHWCTGLGCAGKLEIRDGTRSGCLDTRAEGFRALDHQEGAMSFHSFCLLAL